MSKIAYCKICKKLDIVIFHHTDYINNIGILVCFKCHWKIHNTNILSLLKYKPIGDRKIYEKGYLDTFNLCEGVIDV